ILNLFLREFDKNQKFFCFFFMDYCSKCYRICVFHSKIKKHRKTITLLIQQGFYGFVSKKYLFKCYKY
ncbi:hypothetical protein CUS55_07460, partial [Enterococcus faecium]